MFSRTMTRPPRLGIRGGRVGEEEGFGSASTDGHHVEAKVPGRATGGSSRTVGRVKVWRAVEAGLRGVTVTVIEEAP
jgi:hypothetical protein